MINKSILHIFPFLFNEQIREELVRKELAKIPQGESILDVGAGECKFKKYCGHLKYKAQDFAQYTGEGDGRGLQMGKWDNSQIDIVSDITKIPVKSRSVDNILCTAVLEHVPYPDLSIREMARILKTGGKMILSTPFCAQTHFAPFFYFSGFSKYWYEEIAEKYRLKIVRLSEMGNYFDYMGQELVRLPRVLRRYSKLGPASYLVYFILLPLIVVVWMCSLVAGESKEQLCFGLLVIAEKQ